MGMEKGFDTWDYVVTIAVLATSAIIGIYYAWKSRYLKTTHDFLVANSKLGVIPLTLSAGATALTPITLLAQPTEVYTNGLQVMLGVMFFVIGTTFAMQSVIPVYFRLNVSTINEYNERRFNRFLRIIPALVSIVQSILIQGALVHLTSLMFSSATNASYWLSMVIICGICAFYSAVGGFTAVVWTDVLQALVVIVAVAVLVIKGTMDMGGISKIWNVNYEGDRTIMIRQSFDNPTNYSLWSLVTGGFLMGLGSTLTSQALLQRQNANKTLFKAKLMVVSSVIVYCLVNFAVDWFGLVIYARFHDCDPLLNKEVRSRDQMTAYFAQEIFSNMDGILGLYIAGILAASLSTLSSIINAFSAIIMMDFVKPCIPNLQDRTATILSKLCGLLFGVAIMASTLLVSHFSAMKQLVLMIAGSSIGPIAGIFMLGFFFPWATKTGASAGYVGSIGLCIWASVGRFMNLHQIETRNTLPVRSDGCAASVHDYLNQTSTNVHNNFTTVINQTLWIDSSRLLNIMQNHTNNTVQSETTSKVFGLYLVAPLWYYSMAVLAALVIGMVVSVTIGPNDPEAVDPRLISPLTWSLVAKLPIKIRKLLGFKSEKYYGDMKWACFSNEPRDFVEAEMAVLKKDSKAEENYDNGKIASA